MFDVTAIGELLIDFTPAGKGSMGNPCFEMNPGGAPANCLAALNKLGGKTAFIGKVGQDLFGDFLYSVLEKEGIETRGISETDETNTTLAFVSLYENGEREFAFVRKPGADVLLRNEDIVASIIESSKIIHFGSLSMTHEPARSTVISAVENAKKMGKSISYDPNYRPLLWDSEANAIQWMKKGLQYADIVKMSDEEMTLITGVKDIRQGAEALFKSGKKYVFITMGGEGAYYQCENGNGFVPPFKVDPVDTTGCGDAFTGALLYELCYEKDKNPYEMVLFANAVGALCATKKGGIPSMPAMGEVIKLMEAKKNEAR
jgi:fructokinase